MAKRDPAKTARNKYIAELTKELVQDQAHVMSALNEPTVAALHGRIGGKNAEFIDVRNEIILSPEAYVATWLRGFLATLEGRRPYNSADTYWQLFDELRGDPLVRRYVLTFLRRTYLRNVDALSRRRPTVEEAEIWLGQNRANYGLLVTPRFVRGQWENDKSEIRHFPEQYFTIGHVLATGLVVPGSPNVVRFGDVEQYLVFFESTLVRAAGSHHQDKVAKRYASFVRASANPRSVPLLLPEFRYLGFLTKHEYRLDFTVIDGFTMQKVGFELSPWSSHGALVGTKKKTQAQINEEARGNFEKEMRKHKDYFRKHNVFTLIYTDADLAKPNTVFADVEKYLQPQSTPHQLEIHALDELDRFVP